MIKVPSQISKVTTMSDGGLRLYVDTQELDGKDKAEIMGTHNKIGWFVFSETGISETDIPTEKLDFANETSPAKRMRAVFYRIWEQTTTRHQDFELFYRQQMEFIIEKLKEKLF